MKLPAAEGIWNKGLTRCVSCDCRPRPADMKNSGCDRVWDIEIYNSSMFTEPHIRYDGLPPKNDAGVRYAERFLRFRAARMPVRMRVGRKADGTRPAVSYSPGACRSLPLPYSVPLPFALVRSVRAAAGCRGSRLRPNPARYRAIRTGSFPSERGKADSLVPDDGPVSVPSARRSQSPDRPAGRRYSGIEDRDVLLGRVLRRLFLRAVHDGADVVAFSFDDGFGRGENVPRLVYEHSGIRIAG